jgi:tRNA-Thr(GGU) m(6)t(6)A37 methyltransferase TsaA
MSYPFNPIGIIHTSIRDKHQAPIQSIRSDLPGTVEMFPEFMEGLEGIEEFSHIYLVYIFDRVDQKLELKVKPFLDDHTHGVFTTRFPVRPNPIGFSVVRLLERKEGQLSFMGADMLDGTPLLDIKPYIPDFDIFDVTKTGWYAKRKHA